MAEDIFNKKGMYANTPREELEKEYYRLARRADDRLRRLEGYQYDEHFSAALKWAYATAEHDIKKYGDGIRFKTKAPSNTHTLIAKINDINKFLESPTSTKTGIINVYKSRVKTINARYGTEFTWQQWAEFTESDEFNKMSNALGSKTVLYGLGKIQKNDITIEIDKAGRRVYRANTDDLTVRQIVEYLNEVNTTEELESIIKSFYK